MTQMPRKITRTRTENQEAVSFRLPTALLERLDEAVQTEGSSRTTVIRSALALYHRLAKGGTLLVPATVKTQEKLHELSRRQEIPIEMIASEFLEKSVERASFHLLPTVNVPIHHANRINRSGELKFRVSSGNIRSTDK